MAGIFNVLSQINQAISIRTQFEHQNLYDKFFFLLLSKAGLQKAAGNVCVVKLRPVI